MTAVTKATTRGEAIEPRPRSNRDRGSLAVAPILDQISSLRTRSIFVKGNQTIAGNDSTSGNKSAPADSMVDRPEASLVFNGVTIVNSEADALIEDLISHKVNTVRPGDAIAGGKVSAITFDDLTYQVGGVLKHVAIGENLDGSPATTGGTVAAPAIPAAPGAGPAPLPTGVAPSGASTEDILARMKARRAQELNGK